MLRPAELDARLQPIFDRARQPMPPDLQARLLEIPARQAVATLWWTRRLLPLAAALGLLAVAATAGGRIADFLRHLLGGRIAGAISEGTYRLYSLVMEQWAPWQEALPLAYAAPMFMVFAAAALAALWLSYQPGISRLPAPIPAA